MNNLIDYIDYTSLRDDHKDDMGAVIDDIKNADSVPASVCTWLHHHEFFPGIVNLGAQVSVVLNFSTGTHSLDKVNKEISVINSNPWVSEVDYVVDYKAYQNGNFDLFHHKMSELNKRIEKPVKAILETSSFDVLPQNQRDNLLTSMANDVLGYSCVAMLKTSTGKHFNGGAKLSTAGLLLNVIGSSSRKDVGLKVSGGISDVETASEYFVLASKYYGDSLTPNQFRIGASGLYQKLVNKHHYENALQY